MRYLGTPFPNRAQYFARNEESSLGLHITTEGSIYRYREASFERRVNSVD